MKQRSVIFIVVCMVLCLIPSVGMLFFPTTQTTENRAMAAPPQLFTQEGAVNLSFFQDFEAYFNEHAALRNQLVYTDALIQGNVFQESNISGVIRGTDGWLYYASTLEDYLGLDVMTERELFNLAHNFSLIQDYLLQRDIDFVLTIPPNKNTLYGQYMPYYKSYIVDANHSAQLLAPYLAREQVCYLDLFALFETQEETLYLKRDSHWNMKGACLAYNCIMNSLGLPHQTYSSPAPTLVKQENGDLNKMLYSFYGPLEENYVYDLPQEYVWTQGDDVEDGWIVTENPGGSGTLLMFRDSFANTLIPFLSNQFRAACYSKGEPNAMERYIENYDPDYVVIQKVERNIGNYLTDPPILTPPEAELPERIRITETTTTVLVEDCLNDVNYCRISGIIDDARLQADSQVLVGVNDVVYRAYHTGEAGFCLYLKKAALPEDGQLRVYIVNGDEAILGATATL